MQKVDTFMGFKIYVHPSLDNAPKVQLSPQVVDIIGPYNPDFVVQYNEWLADFFGREDQVMMVGKPVRAIHVGPNTEQKMYEILQNDSIKRE